MSDALARLIQGTAPPSPTTPPAQSPLFGVSTNAPRQNPENMFTPAQNLAVYQQYAKPGPYQTMLSPVEESQFRQWVAQQPNLRGQDVFSPNADYDMRGFWQALKAGDPRATSAINPYDKSIHYPDAWKTPRDATFSNQSMYALPNAPQWRDYPGGYSEYTMPSGQVIFDDRTGRWYGLPQSKPQGK